MDLTDWNAAIFEQLGVGRAPEKRLYLYVSPDSLGALSNLSPAEAVADFCRAFEDASGGRFFGPHRARAQAWRSSGFDGDPPIVAALGMTVLPVTDDPIGSPSGVYRNQNRLLGLPADAKEPPNYGTDVPIMWQIWNEWLRGPGRRYGRPSARTGEHYTRQGWARSQGLIRYSDRVQIEDFLEGLRVGPTDMKRPDLVASQFMAWLRWRGASGAGLLARLMDEAAQAVLVDVLDDELRAWTGVRRRSAHRAGSTVNGLLFFDAWNDSFEVTFPVDERVIGTEIRVGESESWAPSEFDDHVRVDVGESAVELLEEGARWPLRDGLALRFEAAPAYAMREDVNLGGWVQARGDVAGRYRILARDSVREQVAAAIGRPLSDSSTRPSPAEGWVWFEDVAPTGDSDELRSLGLGAVAEEQPGGLRLEGGLRISSNTYLAGGEPDVISPEGVDLLLDGNPFPKFPGRVAALSTTSLRPGKHAVTRSGDSDAVRFTNVGWVRQRAEASQIGWQSSSARTATNREGGASQVAGALVSGHNVPPPLAAQVRPGFEILAVLEDAQILQVTPTPEVWLQQVGLQPSTIDVPRALRETSPRAAFLVVHNPTRATTHAVSIPSTLAMCPGRVETRPRPDRLSALIAKWDWIGPADEERRKQVLGAAFAGRHSTASGTPGPPLRTPSPRADVVEGRLANPYEDVLEWLSERERSDASLEAFANTWAWACNRRRRPALTSQWRLALHRLASLGHIEVDWRSRRVGTAPAALVALPSAQGLMLLTGARPRRLLRRMTHDTDANVDVADAALCLEVHFRSQIGSDGAPQGPASAYVEVDPAQMPLILRSMSALGVTVSGLSSDGLLMWHSSIHDAARTGMAFALSPSRAPELRVRDKSGEASFRTRADDVSPGLYRYRLARGDQFGWRQERGGPMVRVDLVTGLWLDEVRSGMPDHFRFSIIDRKLAYRGRLPLPPLIERALVLRSGLWPTSDSQLVRGWPNRATVFVNVDAATAERVTQLLGQPNPDSF